MSQVATVEATTVVKGTRANARLIKRNLATAEKKMREAMAALAEAQQAIIAGENEANIKLPEFKDLHSATRVVARSTSLLQLSWEEYEEARIGA